MCLSVPMRVIERDPAADSPMPMGIVDAAGDRRICCFAYLPDAREGDWVLVQGGFAVTLLSAEDAQLSLDSFARFGRDGEKRG